MWIAKTSTPNPSFVKPMLNYIVTDFAKKPGRTE